MLGVSYLSKGPYPFLYNGTNNYSRWVNGYNKYADDALGYTQYKNTMASVQAQIDYNNYLKAGNERALRDYTKNVGRSIKYPELSYPGAIYRADTGSARSMYDSDIAGANYRGNLVFRAAGLYGIGSRVARWL